jgi:hypothetical protein
MKKVLQRMTVHKTSQTGIPVKKALLAIQAHQALLTTRKRGLDAALQTKAQMFLTKKKDRKAISNRAVNAVVVYKITTAFFILSILLLIKYFGLSF